MGSDNKKPDSVKELPYAQGGGGGGHCSQFLREIGGVGAGLGLWAIEKCVFFKGFGIWILDFGLRKILRPICHIH